MSAPVPRVCVLQKRSEGEEYGFNLHAERDKGQFVGAVDVGSPADVAGLCPGDHIVAVNGVKIGGQSHREVVDRIKSDPLRCSLLVLDEEGVQWYKERNQALGDGPAAVGGSSTFSAQRTDADESELSPNEEFSSAHFGDFDYSSLEDLGTEAESGSCSIVLPATADATSLSSGGAISDQTPLPERQSAVSPAASGPRHPEQPSDAIPRHQSQPSQPVDPTKLLSIGPKPRLCTLNKASPSDEFGFNLHAERGKGHFVGAVDKGGIADRAGLETGQRIVGVNGRLVSAQTPHKEIVQLIKREPLRTELLLAAEEVDRFYAGNGLAFSYEFAQLFDPAARNGAPQNGRSRAQSKNNGHHLQRSATVEEQQQSRGHSEAPRARGDSLLGQNGPTSTTYSSGAPPPVAVRIRNEPDNRTHIQINELDDCGSCLSSASSTATQRQGTVATPNGDTRAEDKHVLASGTPPPPQQPAKRGSTPAAPLIVPPPYPQKEKLVESCSSGSPSSGHSPPEKKGSTLGCLNFSPPPADSRDIFALSAQEARKLMCGRKRDPRLHHMTLEEKYRLILDL